MLDQLGFSELWINQNNILTIRLNIPVMIEPPKNMRYFPSKIHVQCVYLLYFQIIGFVFAFVLCRAIGKDDFVV